MRTMIRTIRDAFADPLGLLATPKRREPQELTAARRRIAYLEADYRGVMEALERAHARLDIGAGHSAQSWADRGRWTAVKLDKYGHQHQWRPVGFGRDYYAPTTELPEPRRGVQGTIVDGDTL
jgi:hypothetical protein